MMNKLQVIQAAIDNFTNELISFCKPFMQQKDIRTQVTTLLSSESNLRMTIDYACEAQTADDCRKKIALTLEELLLISKTIEEIKAGNAEQKYALLYKVGEITTELEEVLNG